MLGRKEELALANETADADRRKRPEGVQRNEDQRLLAEEECRREAQRNRVLLILLQGRQMSPDHIKNLQNNAVLFQKGKPYPRNPSTPVAIFPPSAYQVRPAESRDVRLDL